MSRHGRRQRPGIGQVEEVARGVFGHDDLREPQQEAIGALLDGHDVLVVAPTGSGKSLAYQLSALMLEGLTVVVSPLLALQQDQIDSLLSAVPDLQAVRLSSAETEAERRQALSALSEGHLKFVFLAPEQLANQEVLDRLSDAKPSLVAVDEAHCVSAWGHDFRPDYQRLGGWVKALGQPRVVALTATAAPPVREDIVASLGMHDPRVIVHGYARDNIFLDVTRCLSADEQRRAVLRAAESTSGLGIVYTATRRAAEEYAQALAEAGLRSAAYHAGRPKRTRQAVQAQFIEGQLDVIAATSAFGMGIDKPDIRYVLHANVPDSPDSYYQEIGRAGRDGEAALAVLFYRPEDLSLARYHVVGVPAESEVAAVLRAADERPDDADPVQIAEATGLSRRRAARILHLLSQVRYGRSSTSMVQAAVSQAESHRALQRSRVEMMRAYSETTQCRRQFLLGYFGEELDRPCAACDNCAAGLASGQTVAQPSAYAVQARVEHAEFGAGTVMDLAGDTVTVLFDDVGYRTLHLPTVQERELMRLR
jgi:ATP-dependent DNA helicase RecQ